MGWGLKQLNGYVLATINFTLDRVDKVKPKAWFKYSLIDWQKNSKFDDVLISNGGQII